VITLEQLYFADEVRPVEDLKPKRERVDKRELEMAQQLIDSFTGDWEPEKYSDTYRDALCDVIEAKRKGKDVHVAAEPEEERPTDLLEALRRSVEASKGGRRPSGNGSRRDEFDELSKSELDKRARDADIEGRSKMTKGELIEALRSAA
jgi:DNA end-binding protein Ku